MTKYSIPRRKTSLTAITLIWFLITIMGTYGFFELKIKFKKYYKKALYFSPQYYPDDFNPKYNYKYRDLLQNR